MKQDKNDLVVEFMIGYYTFALTAAFFALSVITFGLFPCLLAILGVGEKKKK